MGHGHKMCRIMLLELKPSHFTGQGIYPYSFSLTKGCSNNTAEYEISGLELALQIPNANLTIYNDSELIVKQLCINYIGKKAELIPYHNQAENLFRERK